MGYSKSILFFTIMLAIYQLSNSWCSIMVGCNSSRACSGWQEAVETEKVCQLITLREGFLQDLTQDGWGHPVSIIRFMYFCVPRETAVHDVTRGGTQSSTLSQSLSAVGKGGNHGPCEWLHLQFGDHCLIVGFSCLIVRSCPKVLQRLLETLSTLALQVEV